MTPSFPTLLALLFVVGLASAAGAQTDVVTSYTLPPETLARAEALYRTRVAMMIAGTVYSFAVMALLLWLRVAPRLRDVAERVSARRFVQALVFAPAFLLTLDVLSLPVTIYGQSLDLRYGLSVQSWPSWAWDWTKGELLGVGIGTLLVWGLYSVLRRFPTRWWFYGWLGLLPLLLLLMLVGPIYIAPLFDTFTPLESTQPALVPELEKVMARGGLSIERARMFEMAASDKVTTYNAYVTGIGASKRVVVWDNTSRDLTMPETMFVFGHEMGHYVLQHIWLSLGFAVVGLLLQLYLAHRLLRRGAGALRGALGRARRERLGVAAGDPGADGAVLDRVTAGGHGVLALSRASGRHLRARGDARPHGRLIASRGTRVPEARREGAGLSHASSALCVLGGEPSAHSRAAAVRARLPALGARRARAVSAIAAT